MPSAEPLIERHEATAIVHLEVPVMKVVNIGRRIDFGLTVHVDLSEAAMILAGTKSQILEVIDHQQGVRGKNPMNEDCRKI